MPTPKARLAPIYISVDEINWGYAPSGIDQMNGKPGPGANDPSSVVWLYHSHNYEPRATDAGLIGAIVTTRRERAHDGGYECAVPSIAVNQACRGRAAGRGAGTVTSVQNWGGLALALFWREGYHNIVPSGQAPWLAFSAQQLQAPNGNRSTQSSERNGFVHAMCIFAKLGTQ